MWLFSSKYKVLLEGLHDKDSPLQKLNAPNNLVKDVKPIVWEYLTRDWQVSMYFLGSPNSQAFGIKREYWLVNIRQFQCLQFILYSSHISYTTVDVFSKFSTFDQFLQFIIMQSSRLWSLFWIQVTWKVNFKFSFVLSCPVLSCPPHQVPAWSAWTLFAPFSVNWSFGVLPSLGIIFPTILQQSIEQEKSYIHRFVGWTDIWNSKVTITLRLSLSCPRLRASFWGRKPQTFCPHRSYPPQGVHSPTSSVKYDRGTRKCFCYWCILKDCWKIKYETKHKRHDSRKL